MKELICPCGYRSPYWMFSIVSLSKGVWRCPQCAVKLIIPGKSVIQIIYCNN